MIDRIISNIILSLGLILAGLFIGYGLYFSKINSQAIEVKGLAEMIVKSDEAIWAINIKVVNNDLPTLYKSINDAQNKITKFLNNAGFSGNEININSVMVNDNQSNNFNQNTTALRYSADAGITISTSKVDLVLEQLQKTGDLVAQGIVVTSSSAIYRYNSLNSIKPSMLIAAIKNAHDAANTFAVNANTKLGKIKHASQGLFTITDANSNYDSGTSIMKKVRVVTSVDYEIK